MAQPLTSLVQQYAACPESFLPVLYYNACSFPIPIPSTIIAFSVLVLSSEPQLDTVDIKSGRQIVYPPRILYALFGYHNPLCHGGSDHAIMNNSTVFCIHTLPPPFFLLFLVSSGFLVYLLILSGGSCVLSDLGISTTSQQASDFRHGITTARGEYQGPLRLTLLAFCFQSGTLGALEHMGCFLGT